MSVHLFLSPHFDDAALSCGGTVHRLGQRGEAVTVQTVMGGVPVVMPDTTIVRTLHERWQLGEQPVYRRAQEDQAAIHGLGAEWVRMEYWEDCIYRLSRDGRPLYDNGEAIFDFPDPDDQTAHLLPSVVIAAERLDTLYAPLAAGNHVDHQIVRNWALNLRTLSPWIMLKFYEDYPYSAQEQAVERARQHFIRLGIMLRQEVVVLDDAAVEARIAAIACYTSQISSFWPDLATMAASVRETLLRAGDGVPAERFWIAE
jgi:LmbE family N-acetylglucosaminyl deacetylase